MDKRANIFMIASLPIVSAYEPDSEPSLIAAKMSRLLSDAQPPVQIVSEQEVSTNRPSVRHTVGQSVN